MTLSGNMSIKQTGLKLVVPIGFISICIFLFRRIKSNRL